MSGGETGLSLVDMQASQRASGRAVLRWPGLTPPPLFSLVIRKEQVDVPGRQRPGTSWLGQLWLRSCPPRTQAPESFPEQVTGTQHCCPRCRLPGPCPRFTRFWVGVRGLRQVVEPGLTPCSRRRVSEATLGPQRNCVLLHTALRGGVQRGLARASTRAGPELAQGPRRSTEDGRTSATCGWQVFFR